MQAAIGKFGKCKDHFSNLLKIHVESVEFVCKCKDENKNKASLGPRKHRRAAPSRSRVSPLVTSQNAHAPSKLYSKRAGARGPAVVLRIWACAERNFF